MALSIKHLFASLKSDGIDPSLVQPSNWNAEHVILMGANTLLGRGAGAGAASEISIDLIGVPIGMPFPWLADAGLIPSNYILLANQNVSRATYVDLFTLWGTKYGVGNGSTTFGIPDFRGRAPIGKDDMGGSAAGRVTTAGSGVDGLTLGAVGGTETVALTGAQNGPHTHGTPSNIQSGNDIQAGPGLAAGLINDGSTGSSGSGTPHQNMIPVIVTNWIVKATRF